MPAMTEWILFDTLSQRLCVMLLNDGFGSQNHDWSIPSQRRGAASDCDVHSL